MYFDDLLFGSRYILLYVSMSFILTFVCAISTLTQLFALSVFFPVPGRSLGLLPAKQLAQKTREGQLRKVTKSREVLTVGFGATIR